MLVYDITKPQTFEHIMRWLEELRGHADKNIVVILVGNKSDLVTQRVVSLEEAKEFAESENLFFIETSALESTNVETAFLTVLTEIYKTHCKKALMGREDEPEGTNLLGGTNIDLSGQDHTGTPSKSTCCFS
jgi:Ras-related protein Rab-11A